MQKVTKLVVKASAAACFLALASQASAKLNTEEMIIVHPFQWTYDSIAEECEQVLGPKGYDGVQISQPAEHINRSDVWWAVYQPVNYNNFTTMTGNEQQLRSMIQRCNKAGVKVFADAVFNQRGNSGNVGFGGSSFNASAPWYPDSDSSYYHTDCYKSIDYGDANSIRNCRLSGMPDMATERDHVRTMLGNYLKTLLDMGVYGFRIDAAKHMQPDDISAILGKAGNPPAYLEVIGANGEPVQPSHYKSVPNSVVTEFGYCNAMLKNIDNPKYLINMDDSWFQMGSADSEVFVVNHDNERGSAGTSYLNYKHGQKYNLAQSFLVAYPQGKIRQVYTGYQFNTHDQGGPLGAERCTGGWNCEHHLSIVNNAVGFARATRGTGVTSKGSDDKLIWFNRGSKGFYAMNANGYDVTKTFTVEVPDGTYCEILQQDSKCGGQQINVVGGKAEVYIPAMSAAAFCVEPEGGNGFCGGEVVPPVPQVFNQLYFVGTPNSWKHEPMTLSDDGKYWIAKVNFDGKGDTSGKDRFKITTTPDWNGDVYGTSGSDTLCKNQSTCKDITPSTSGNVIVKIANDKSNPKLTVVAAGENHAPEAKFTASVEDMVVKFTNQSTDEDGDKLTYTWDFGDDQVSTEANPEHVYDKEGTYIVTLVANDGHKSSVVASEKVTVAREQCKPNVDALYYAGTTNKWTHDAMKFNTASCKWEIALNLDGKGDSAGSARFKVTSAPNWKNKVWGKKSGNQLCSDQSKCGDVTYSEKGAYVLSVNDRDMTWALAKAGNNAPIASFKVNVNGLSFSALNTSSDEDNDSLTYVWDFGDGYTSTDKTPQHTYDVAGDYTVTLTVSDGKDETKASEVVTVIDTPACNQVHPAMYYAGTTNKWTHSEMKYDNKNCKWYIDLELTGNGDSAGSQRFKVTSAPNWKNTVWGDAKFDNKLCSDQARCPDVKIGEVGSYRLVVDDADLVWSLEAK